MEHLEFKEYLHDFRKSLTEHTSCLVRIEERLKNFIERVETHEEELEDVKTHVQTVRTVSKIFTICMGMLATAVSIWRALS